MDMDTSHRQSAFSRVKEPKVEGAQECKPFHLTELRTVSPQVPHTLPGAGIQNRIPVQPFYPPPDVILQMFQPFHNGNYLPPEVFGRPMGLHGLPPVSTPSTSTETSAMAKDPAIQHLIRQQHEDRDSGNESSTLSPVSSFSSSRSPSNSSRSNSFSMSTLLKPSDLVPQGNIQPAGVNFGLGSSLPPLEAKSLPAHMQHAHLSQLNLFQQNGLQKSLGPFSAMSPLAPNPHQMNAQFMGQIQQFEQFRRLAQNPPFDPLMAGPFREMCDICGDNASGYHYGVMSCEGCKGFFRRTVQKGTEYRCHRDSSCRVDRVTRNRCQSCRYKRCLEKGMAKESVRLDRGRKSKRNGEEAQRQLEDVKEIMTSIEETKASFKAAFPEQVKMQSPQDVVMRCVLFTSALRLFSVVDKEHHDYLAKKSCRGVALLRAALSADECLPVVGEDKELVLKIKAGIEIASYDDLAVLTAVYIASHSDDIELQDQLSRCLRSQLKTRLSNEEHLFSALMGKLALLS